MIIMILYIIRHRHRTVSLCLRAYWLGFAAGYSLHNQVCLPQAASAVCAADRALARAATVLHRFRLS